MHLLKRGKAENFTLILGNKQMLEDFEKALLGMQASEEKEFPLTFPSGYHAEHLAGKEAFFKVKLCQIQAREALEINDELAKIVLANEENATLELLKERVKGQLFLENKARLYNEELKEKLIENLDEKILFDLPKTIIEQEMDLLFRNALYSMQAEEVKSLQESQEKAKEKRESFRNDATKSVKITFIIDALAKEEKIGVHDNEVFQTLYYEAMMTGQNPENLIEQYRKNNMLAAVKMAMIEDRVLTYLLDKNLPKEQRRNFGKNEYLTLKKLKWVKRLKGKMMGYIPYVIENTERGERSYDIYSRLLKDRIVLLSGEINDSVASSIVYSTLVFGS